MHVHVTGTMDGRRPLEGFGFQCDGYLYDATNAAAGVGEADYALIERRLRAIRPSLSRLFCHVNSFNPSLDGRTFQWDLPEYRNLLRMLRVLDSIGTRVNLVLFQPCGGLSRDTYANVVRATADLLARLRDVEGIRAVRWLTLYNEPETSFPHDSPLMRRLFGDAAVEGPARWDLLVDLWRLAQERIEALGLYPQVKLAVPDCVWGSPVRYERMRLAAEAFRGRDVTFAVHVYSPEDTSTQPKDEAHQRDWGYPGMAREAADFRVLAGPDRTLILWEYNLEGLGGRTSLFPGVNRHGVSVLETADAGPELLEKTILAVNHGYDGACLWCMTDMFYCGTTTASMQLGLWRFKPANWYPRPHYYYYAPLCQAFRDGMTLLRLDGLEAPVLGLAAAGDEGTALVLVNRGATPQTLALEGFTVPRLQRLRIHPDAIPFTGGDLPLENRDTLAPDAAGVFRLDLLPREAVYLQTHDHRQEGRS